MSTIKKDYNLLFIFPDQLGAEWIGCYGNPDVKAPFLDRFANESLLFENAFTNCPLCTPYRSTLFTSRYPLQTGVLENNFHIPDQEIVLPQLLNQAGYKTSYVGKWHLSGAGREHYQGEGFRWVPSEDRLGFQEFIGWKSWHIDHWNGVIWENDPDTPIKMPGHETDALTDIAIERLNKLKDETFALFVAYQAPHPPCAPPERFKELYHHDQMIGRTNQKADCSLYDRAVDDQISQPEFMRKYFGEISHLDVAIERLVKYLEIIGVADRTIVIFTSDHGEMNGAHGLFGKSVMYEEALHVPLIVYHPDGARNSQAEQLIASVDLMPTILDLLEVDIPETCEGLSYASLIRGEDQLKTHQAVFSHYSVSGIQGLAKGDHLACVRTQQYKLVTRFDGFEVGEPLLLFDLHADPYEQNNLRKEKPLLSIRDSLLEDLTEWAEDIKTRQGNLEKAAWPAAKFR